jgi:hypothetical protein
MIARDDETMIVDLLAPLQRIEPVPLPLTRRSSRRSPVLVAALIAAALAVTGVAIAAGVGAFDGIGAAEHPRTQADIIDAQTQRYLQHKVPTMLFHTSRLVGRLPSGRRIWVVKNVRGDLCEVIERAMDACGGALSDTQPTTIATYDRDGPGGEPPVSFGVARDGVSAISFLARGHEVTVPVKHNVWAYEGESAVLKSATVHFADGASASLKYGSTTR